MIRDVSALGLLKGDRLEPSPALEDVGKFELLGQGPFPVEVIFWRVANQTITHHRNPLFAPGTGVTLLSISIDALHTLHLGVYQAYCLAVLWPIINNNAFRVHAGNQDVLIQLSVMRCRHELFAWYKEQRRAMPNAKLYELQDLVPSMLGTQKRKHLHTKAAETGTPLGFCVGLVVAHEASFGLQGGALRSVGEALLRVRRIQQESPRAMSAPQVQELVDAAKEAFVLRERAGVPFTPKWHLMLEMVAKARTMGNPKFYHTFLDEDYNGRLAAVARACHRLTWHMSVLKNSRWAFTTKAIKRRRLRQ